MTGGTSGMNGTLAVMASIRPMYCAEIADLRKLLEVRKTKPNLPVPFKVYIYCTKFKYGEILCFPEWKTGKVIGEFICDHVFCYTTSSIKDGVDISDADMERMSRLSHAELSKYEYSAKVRENCIYTIGLYGWHISNLKIYDKPREISEFMRPCQRVACVACEYGYRGGTVCDAYLKRPPQSWCYVEEAAT